MLHFIAPLVRLPALALILLGMITTACADPSPPTAPDAEMVAPPTDTTGASRTVTGRFVRTGYDVQGTVTVQLVGDVATITFSSDFAIGRTPGPFVYLNTERDPNRGQPLRIGALRASQGAQSYTVRVPANVAFRYVVIWCDPFNVAMADAAIDWP